MLNEVKSLKLKKVIQTVIYIPYFLSWVIVGGIIFDLFGIGGLFNNIRQFFGLKPLLVMQKESWYRPIYVIAWQSGRNLVGEQSYIWRQLVVWIHLFTRLRLLMEQVDLEKLDILHFHF